MTTQKLFEEQIREAIKLTPCEERIADTQDRCSRITGMTPLQCQYHSGFQGVSTLKASPNTQLLLNRIEQFPNLRHLAVKDMQVNLEKLPPSLEHFSTYNPVDLAKLTHLERLKRLEIVHSGGTDLSTLPDGGLPQVEELVFCSLKEEEALARLENLRLIVCGHIKDGCAPFGKLKKLRQLYIETFNAPSLDGIEGCENLEVFRLQSDALCDISALAKLSKLRVFGVINHKNGANITDLSALEGLPLEELHLPECNVEDFSVLASLKELRVLNLQGTLLCDLSVLEGLENLEEVYLYGADSFSRNDPHFFKPLEKLPRLRKIGVHSYADSSMPENLRNMIDPCHWEHREMRYF